MCTCASCEYTDGFHDAGFAAWPRGNPAGPRKSAAEYAAHVAHLWEGVPRHAIRFEPGQQPQFPAWMRGNGPIAPAPKWLHDWINRKAPDLDESRPASPAQPGKAGPHFPAQDRPRETATIYAMPKAKAEKRPVGRPAMQGRRVVIKLEEEQIRRAEKLGGGNVAAGIRRALEIKSGS